MAWMRSISRGSDGDKLDRNIIMDIGKEQHAGFPRVFLEVRTPLRSALSPGL